MDYTSEITSLLIDWSKGDRIALEKLLPLVEKELHRLAHFQMRRLKPGNTFQTTALINETYLRLINQNRVEWQNRAHFFGIAAKLMRRILLNYARDQRRQKRGGGTAVHVTLCDEAIVSPDKTEELLAIDEALQKLADLDERKCRVVELRFFGGLNIEEIAEVLKVSTVTVSRDWNMARAWLAREIGNGN